MDKLFTCQELAERYHVTSDTVIKWVKQKKIPAIKVGKGYLFQPEDVEQFEREAKTM